MQFVRLWTMDMTFFICTRTVLQIFFPYFGREKRKSLRIPITESIRLV